MITMLCNLYRKFLKIVLSVKFIIVFCVSCFFFSKCNTLKMIVYANGEIVYNNNCTKATKTEIALNEFFLFMVTGSQLWGTVALYYKQELKGLWKHWFINNITILILKYLIHQQNLHIPTLLLILSSLMLPLNFSVHLRSKSIKMWLET